MRITSEQIDEIMTSFEKLRISKNTPALPFDIKSLQEAFNGKIAPLLEAAPLDEETLALIQKLLLIEEYQTFSDEEQNLEFFFHIFGDTIGLFGITEIGKNFRILRLCFTTPENQRESQTFDFVFHGFTKIFLPDADAVEFINALKDNPSVTRSDLKFSMTQSGTLHTITVLAVAE